MGAYTAPGASEAHVHTYRLRLSNGNNPIQGSMAMKWHWTSGPLDFSISQHVIVGHGERKDWMKGTEKFLQENECSGQRDCKVQGSSSNTALQGFGWLPLRSWESLATRGQNVHWTITKIRVALCEEETERGSFVNCPVLVSICCLLFRQGAQKGFLYYDMFTASQTTMCGKRLPSDQIHSFPIL